MKLIYASRKNLLDGDFVFFETRHDPIEDAAHASDALADQVKILKSQIP